ncbi:MAG TPA: hypothetical protein VF613_13270 [Longimicrobium sp.]|jgi:hypothetical protein
MTFHRRLLLAACVLLVGACERGSTGSRPPVVREDELVFIRSAANAPRLVSTDTSFWAVAGDGREIRIPYVNGAACLEFKVPGNALLRRPDGSAIHRGDSVRITVRLADPGRFSFEFQPAGLRFNRDHPAELRIRYTYANRDFNGDGVVDDADRAFDFGLWRQEGAGRPWAGLVTIRDSDTQEVRATLEGFTKFAVAGN